MVNTVPNNSSVCRGWFSGVHPYVRDGVVERSVCVKENETSCHRQFTVRIRNCFGFYVYNFPPKREADGFSYCFEKGTVLTSVMMMMIMMMMMMIIMMMMMMMMMMMILMMMMMMMMMMTLRSCTRSKI